MYHCHMANHEDGGLMGQFLVCKDPSSIKKDLNGKIPFQGTAEHPLTPDLIKAADRQAQTAAPSFQSADLAGNPLSLASLTQAKPLVLFFIERECPCSRDAAPFLDKLAAEYGDSCTVVGVINADAATARGWVMQTGARFPLIADADQAIIKSYGAKRSVYTTVVAPGGKIVKTYPGYSAETLAELSATLARLGGVTKRDLILADAPAQVVSGCPFPSR
jgi:peroxiredoxin